MGDLGPPMMYYKDRYPSAQYNNVEWLHTVMPVVNTDHEPTCRAKHKNVALLQLHIIVITAPSCVTWTGSIAAGATGRLWKA